MDQDNKQIRPDDSEQAGVALERLVALVETSLAGDRRSTVERRKRLRDQDTGRLREHDVVITWSDRHHTVITALECRDRSRPVGVPDVEGFHAKCERTGVHRGVIVSASGFRESARIKADQLGIGCMEMGVAEAFEWCETPGIIGRHKHIRHMDVHVGLGDDERARRFVSEGMEFTIFTPDDVVFDAPRMNATVDANIPWGEFSLGEQHSARLLLNPPGLYVRSLNGERFEAVSVILDVLFEVEEVVHPLLFRSYSDGKHTYAVAAGSFEARGKTIRVAMVRDSSDEIHVSASIDDSRLL